jgi:hypothetical protein
MVPPVYINKTLARERLLLFGIGMPGKDCYDY